MNLQNKILNLLLIIYLLFLTLGGIWFIGIMVGTTTPILALMEVQILTLSLIFLATISSILGIVFSIKNLILQKTNSLIIKGTYLIFSPIILVILILFLIFMTRNQIEMGRGFLITYGFTILGSILVIIGNLTYILGSLKKQDNYKLPPSKDTKL